jgi:formiminotetrahydrofolate cyclodeaminase
MDTRLTELPVGELVARLASDAPVPGGGSASALAGSLAAALVHMVVELTAGRSEADRDDAALVEIRTAAASLQSELTRLVDADAAAYAAVMAARRLPRDSDLERAARRVQLEAAIRDATRAPLATARNASDVLGLAERLAPIGNRNAISDVGVAALLAAAAVHGAILNVRINLPHIANDEALRSEAEDEAVRLLAGLEDRERSVRDAVAERIG